MLDDKLLKQVMAIAVEAGQAILAYYQKPKEQLNAQLKHDQSPVTLADLAAHEIIANGLSQLIPALPILSEEDKQPLAYQQRKQWSHYWLIDPLDGTRGFIAGLPEFSVNIALIDHHQPVLGIIYDPVADAIYSAMKDCGTHKGRFDQREKLKARQTDWHSVTVATGHYHNPKRLIRVFGDQIPYRRLELNSSLKFCRLAQGLADFYPRFGPTSEWDTAAGQCILEQAGGLVVDLSGEPMQYNAKSSLENGAFVAIADPSTKARLLPLLTRSLT